MLSKLHSLNLDLCRKQYNKNFVLHLKGVPQLGGSWQHNYSTKTRQAMPMSVYVFSYVNGASGDISAIEIVVYK